MMATDEEIIRQAKIDSQQRLGMAKRANAHDPSTQQTGWRQQVAKPDPQQVQNDLLQKEGLFDPNDPEAYQKYLQSRNDLPGIDGLTQ